MSNTLFSTKDWFKHFTGFEESVEAVYKNLIYKEFQDHDEIISKINGRKFICGKFSTRTIDSFEGLKFPGNGVFNIIRGDGPSSRHFEEIDVTSMENMEKYNGSTFQAASNFNCLEFPNHTCSAANGINSYSKDLTQGPCLCTPCFAGTLVRNYFVPHDGYNGQIEHMINLLDKTPIRVVGSKAMINREDIQMLSNFDFTDESNYKVGVHQNLQVLCSKKDRYTCCESKPGQIVHQVFGASFSMGGYCSEIPEVFNILDPLLSAQYKATILAALENSQKFPGLEGSNKCILTTLGAGSFYNPPEIVAKAIVNAKDIIMKSGLEVYLVCFDNNPRRGFPAFYPYLKSLVEETNGKVIDVR